MVERVDEGVGQILAALDRLDLARDTVVIFTNDNGGEWLSRNDPFSHYKSTLWEGGIRVPLILRWPGRLPAGATSPQVAITMDLTASILALAGVPRTEQPALDGIDVLPVLAGEAPTVERRLFWRMANRRTQQKAVRDGHWKLLIDAGDSRLFDLAADPGEQRDLAAAHPDRVRALEAAMEAWEQEVDMKK
jgi:arylsulfatase A-like enzyme